MNSDIVCEFPLQEMIDFHKHHGKLATIMISQQENPSRFGVIETLKYPGDKYYKVTSFTEKPTEFISSNVNGGVYVFSNKVLDMI